MPFDLDPFCSSRLLDLTNHKLSILRDSYQNKAGNDRKRTLIEQVENGRKRPVNEQGGGKQKRPRT
ncbi:hypothetical protein FPOAC2_07845 [Fusarium poae]